MLSSVDLLTQAVSYHEAGDLAEAEAAYRKILAGEPGHPDAWHLLGLILRERGELEAAILHIERAIALRPAFPDPYYNLGNIWLGQARWAEAVQCFQRAVQLKPRFAEAYGNLGVALVQLECRAEAIEFYRQALLLRPDYAEAHHNLGRALQDLGRYDEALAHYEAAVSCRPDLAEARAALATLLLLTGDWRRGFDEYEWRWSTGQLEKRAFLQPLWNGEPLEGRAILLHAEQGLGDTLQFIRYASRVKECGGVVSVECPRSLLPLLSRCAGIDRLVAAGDELPAFDVYAPLLSLPRILGTTEATLPRQGPYLFADSQLVERWRDRLKTLMGTAQPALLIGIHWQGRQGPGPYVQRNMPLRSFLPLADLPGVRLVRLQKEGSGDELAELAERLGLIDQGDDFDTAQGAFMDSAAIIQSLDLVITSDTAMVHLAGGLGAEVWVALPFSPDWRWLLARSDSPWYPTMRLFRQPQRGDWDSVFREIAGALRERLGKLPQGLFVGWRGGGFL